MYGMVDMYGMPDPIDTPAMYGPGPEIETVYGVVRRGTEGQKGKVEITSFNDESSAYETEESEITADGIKGIQVIIGTKEKGTIDSCVTSETGEFFLNADKYLNEEIWIAFLDTDGDENGSYYSIPSETFTLSAMYTKLIVTLQPKTSE